MYHDLSSLPERCAAGHGVVYAIKVEGRCKIGITQNPRRRLQGIERAIGAPIEAAYITPQCLNNRLIEKLMHDALDQARTVGEWFEWDFGAIQKVLASHHFYVTEPNLDEVFHKSCRYKAEEMEQLHDRGHPILVRIEPDPRAVHA